MMSGHSKELLSAQHLEAAARPHSAHPSAHVVLSLPRPASAPVRTALWASPRSISQVLADLESACLTARSVPVLCGLQRPRRCELLLCLLFKSPSLKEGGAVPCPDEETEVWTLGQCCPVWWIWTSESGGIQSCDSFCPPPVMLRKLSMGDHIPEPRS